MKKLLLILAAALVAGAVAAQDVEKLVEKYSGKEGVTVVQIDGEMLKNLSGSTVVEGVNISSAIKDVKVVTVIVDETGDKKLAEEMKIIIDGKEYTPIMNATSDGDKIKIVKADAKRGKDGEMIITVDEGTGKSILVKIAGDVDAEAIANGVKAGGK